jgi:uncharacterized protein (TIGR04255 family)
VSNEIYKNAPITEAALDIRVRTPSSLKVEDLLAAKDDAYPDVQQPLLMQFQITAEASAPAPSIKTLSTQLGYMFKSSDGKQVFQARKDGFTHNRLSPYQHWKSFSDEAKRLWEKYKLIAAPEHLELLGLNYANKIFIPVGAEFKEYLRTYIELSPDLPQSVNAYSAAFQVSLPIENAFVHIAQAYGQPSRPDHVTFILNVQAFKTVNKPIADVPDDEIWSTFEELRNAKNEAFQACITDRVREQIR